MILFCDTSALVKLYLREEASDEPLIERAREHLCKDWPSYIVVEVTQAVVELAGEYADTFALQAYGSVQLAAASTLSAKGGEVVRFACFDGHFFKAARVLGMGGR